MSRDAQLPQFGRMINGLLWFLMVGTPLLVLPVSDNFILDTKEGLIIGLGLVMAAMAAVKLLLTGKLRLRKSPLTLAAAGFGAVALLSSLTANRYPLAHLVSLGGVWLAGMTIATLASGFLAKKKHHAPVSSAASWLSIGLGGSILLQLTGFGPSWLIAQLTGLPLTNSAIFNLAGSNLIAAQVLAICLLVIGSSVAQSRSINPLQLVAGLIGLAGLSTSVWLSLPGNIAAAQYTPYLANWSIALDVLRVPRTALVGVGPAFFSDAYQVFKPAYLNLTPLWNIPQIAGSNWPLHLVTTMGLAGLLGWAWLSYQTTRQWWQHQGWQSPAAMLTISSLAMGLIFPPNAAVWALFSTGLAYWLAEQASANTWGASSNTPTNQNKLTKLQATSGRGVALLGLILLAWGGFWLGRTVYSRWLLLRSTQTRLANELVETYNWQQRAVQANPLLDEARRRYAQTNLAIALALSNKAEPTDQDAEQISQLIQQGLREARAATLLRPSHAQNWETQALIYQNLIGVAEGAEEWAVNAYVQAIEASPTDPGLRAELADLFVRLENLQLATQIYGQAINLKPDALTSRYQLAQLLAEQGAIGAAAEQYQILISLTDAQLQPEVTNRLNQELAELETQLEALAADGAEPAATAEDVIQPADPSAQPTDQPTEASLFNDLGQPNPIDPTQVNTSPLGEIELDPESASPSNESTQNLSPLR